MAIPDTSKVVFDWDAKTRSVEYYAQDIDMKALGYEGLTARAFVAPSEETPDISWLGEFVRDRKYALVALGANKDGHYRELTVPTPNAEWNDMRYFLPTQNAYEIAQSLLDAGVEKTVRAALKNARAQVERDARDAKSAYDMFVSIVVRDVAGDEIAFANCCTTMTDSTSTKDDLAHFTDLARESLWEALNDVEKNITARRAALDAIKLP